MKYRCWIPSDGQTEEDGEDIEAFEPQGAAISYAERDHDRAAEYPEETEVYVRDEKRECVLAYWVQWEAIRNYYSSEAGRVIDAKGQTP